MPINRTKRIYTTKSDVPFYNSDFLGRMKLSAILKILAQVAGDDYIDRGMSHHFLMDYGCAFLVSRLALKIHSYPKNEEMVFASTWECGKKGATFLRGYEMTSEDGKVLVEGEGGWICVNMNDRKIIRPKDFPWLCEQTEEKQPPVHIGKINCDGGKLVDEYKLRLNDIDVNGHLYNAFYGDIITNALPKEDFERGFSEIKLNYVSEAVLGDTILVYRTDNDNEIILTGKKNGEICFEFSGLFA